MLLPMPKEGLRLSEREGQILSLISAGLSNKRIARELGISESTVRTHLERLYVRNDVHTRAEAVSLWATLNRTEPAPAKPRMGRGVALWLLCTPLVVSVGLVSYMVSPRYLWASLAHLGPVAGGLATLTIIVGLAGQVVAQVRSRMRGPGFLARPHQPPRTDS